MVKIIAEVIAEISSGPLALTELLLQLLVGKVDQQLLQGVGGEGLEAEDVEHADALAPRPLLAAVVGVDPRHERAEQLRVERLGQGVARLRRRLRRQLDHQLLRAYSTAPYV